MNTYIGLDFETSGTSHKTSAPIQLGIATDASTLSSLIGGWNWKGQPWTNDIKGPYTHTLYKWSDEAEGVHGIPKERLLGQPHADAVDSMMASWVPMATGERNKTKVIAVGWNIAAFDFPFLRQYMPQTTDRIAYRSVDLNAIIFAISEAGMLDKRLGDPWTYYGLKGYVKEQAARMVDGPQMWHDAGYDAATSLAAFRVLTDILGGRYA